MTNRRAFSLIELIVVVGIVLVLLTISIPFLRDTRELTRRRNCDQNLIRLALAIQAYSADTGHFPAGTSTFNAAFETLPSRDIARLSAEPTTDDVEESASSQPDDRPDTHGKSPARLRTVENQSNTAPIRSLPSGYHHNWIEAILPRLDRQGLYESIDTTVGVYADANKLARQTDLPMIRCASAMDQIPATTSYAGLHSSVETPIQVDNDGLFPLNRWVVPDEIPDGAGYTMLLGEKLSIPELDLGWISGTRSSLRNTGHPINAPLSNDDYRDPLFVGGLASRHVGGASVSLADGSIRFLSDTIDQNLLQDLASRDDSADPE